MIVGVLSFPGSDINYVLYACRVLGATLFPDTYPSFFQCYQVNFKIAVSAKAKYIFEGICIQVKPK